MFSLSDELRAVAEDKELPWDDLDGKSILITGATGLIGSLVARTLLERNRVCHVGTSISVCVRNADKARNVFAGYDEADGLRIVEQDLTSFDPNVRCDAIVHAGCPTNSGYFVSNPVETMDAIVGGTRRVLQYAHDCAATHIVYVSSMEVYGSGNSHPGLDHLLNEDSVGYVNPVNVRSCYPEGKRAAEAYCAAYASEYGLRVSTIRLAQTFGPGIDLHDKRLFAQIARAAMSGEDLVLKTTGQSSRMYLYTTDAVRAILMVLAKGNPGQAYNAANPSTYTSIYTMVQQVLEAYSNGRSKLVVDIDPDAPYPPEHHLPLDISELRNLGWEPRISLLEMYGRLIEYLAGSHPLTN